MSFTTKRWASLGALAFTAALVAGACNSGTPSTAPVSAAASEAPASQAASQGPARAAASGGAASTAPSSAPTQAAGGGTGKAPNIFVVGGKADDPFWSRVKRGAEDAGMIVKAEGGSVTWLAPANYNNLGPDAAKLLQTALSQNPGAVVGPDWVPDAEDAAFEAIVAAKVPLIVYNSGYLAAAQKVGALNYVGSDDNVAGATAGKYLASHGFRHALCVNDFPGASFAEARCGGIKQGMTSAGAQYTELPLPSSDYGNQTAVSQAVKAAILKDPTIDVIMTLGVSDEPAVQSAIDQANARSTVKAATFDMDTTTLQDVKSGKLLFTIDQQPYMQGFLAVSMLNQYVQWGLTMPQQPVLTGPAIVDASGVDAALAGAAAGTR